MGDEEEFSEYFAARWSRLVRAAVLLGCSLPEAEDLVQTALARCLVKWHRVQRADDRDAYVHRVLLNTFASARRRRWVHERPSAAMPQHSAADRTDAVDDTDAVMRSLARLPRDQRAVLVLRFYAHLTEPQTADVLGVPVGTVKSRQSRALKALARDTSLTDLRGRP